MLRLCLIQYMLFLFDLVYVISVWSSICYFCLLQYMLSLFDPVYVISVWSSICYLCLIQYMLYLFDPVYVISVWSSICYFCLIQYILFLFDPVYVSSVWSSIYYFCLIQYMSFLYPSQQLILNVTLFITVWHLSNHSCVFCTHYILCTAVLKLGYLRLYRYKLFLFKPHFKELLNCFVIFVIVENTSDFDE